MKRENHIKIALCLNTSLSLEKVKEMGESLMAKKLDFEVRDLCLGLNLCSANYWLNDSGQVVKFSKLNVLISKLGIITASI